MKKSKQNYKKRFYTKTINKKSNQKKFYAKKSKQKLLRILSEKIK